MTTKKQWRAVATELAEAIRLTREYVGEERLPAIPGWSWFDATQKYQETLESEGSVVAFGKNKAAPFVKGGGRKKGSTKTAKGTPKKAPPKGTAKSFSTEGTSPTTAIGGGQFFSKGKKRKSANANPTMRGQAGMISADQAK